jgi:beta-N-acetylhexosaminidase
MGGRAARAGAVLVVAAAIAACTAGMSARPDPTPTASARTTPSAGAAPAGSATPLAVTSSPAVASCVSATYRALTPDQRLGQLFLVGVPVAERTKARATARRLVRDDHVGGVFLAGRSQAGVSTLAALTGSFQALATKAATGGLGLVVATDQEGGKVQVLQGAGFGKIPTALAQGRLTAATLRARATVWGRALHRAGVNLDLAPVADVPAKGNPKANPPIAAFDRQYGYTAATVTAHAAAFAAGLDKSGVDTTWKHFPGLGKVHANTDTTVSVHDTVTTAGSGSLLPFRSAITAGAGWVMVSLAVYDRIDATHRAAYSSKVISGLLRGRFGFEGVVVSDDLGLARSASVLPVGRRAAALIAAGGDVALTVDASGVAAMIDGVRARAASSAAFRARVKASVLRVLTAKRDLGLLPACRP